MAFELHEPVAIGIAARRNPVERRQHMRPQPVDERGIAALGALHIFLVGGEDRLRLLADLRGHRLERPVLHGGLGTRQLARRGARRDAQVLDGLGYVKLLIHLPILAQG